jgi:hypothetical protein
LLFLDLDGFKTVNDSFGHGSGDRLLVELATRIRSSVRAGDTVARLGEDGFIVLLDTVTGADDAARVAAKVLQTARFRFACRDSSLVIPSVRAARGARPPCEAFGQAGARLAPLKTDSVRGVAERGPPSAILLESPASPCRIAPGSRRSPPRARSRARWAFASTAPG